MSALDELRALAAAQDAAEVDNARERGWRCPPGELRFTLEYRLVPDLEDERAALADLLRTTLFVLAPPAPEDAPGGVLILRFPGLDGALTDSRLLGIARDLAAARGLISVEPDTGGPGSRPSPEEGAGGHMAVAELFVGLGLDGAAVRILEDYLDELSGARSKDAPGGDVTSTAGWRAALAMLVLPHDRTERRRLADTVGRSLLVLEGGGASLRQRLVLRTLFWLLSRESDSPTPLPPPLSTGSRETFVAEQLVDLRYLMTDPLLVAPGARLRVRTRLLQHLSPGLFGVHWDDASAFPPDDLRHAVDLLGDSADRWLGTVADLHRRPAGTTTLASLERICDSSVIDLAVTPANERWVRRMLLPGIVGDIHAPLCTAVAESPAELVCDVAARIGDLVRCWPVELMPDALRSGLVRDRDRWTASLIDIADRAGLLGELVWQLASLDRSPRLQAAAALYDAYVGKLHAAPGSPIELRG